MRSTTGLVTVAAAGLPRGRRRALALSGLVTTLMLTAAGCGGGSDDAGAPAAGTAKAAGQATGDGATGDANGDSGNGDGDSGSDGKNGDRAPDGLPLPDDLADRLEEHGIDLDRWRHGAWKDWDEDTWLRAARDFVNPVIDGLWKPERMASAEDAAKTISIQDAGADAGRGVGDPEPQPVQARPERTPYHDNAAPVGKVFFDSPEGSMVCSGTVVKDVNHPGKSNLVWTAGHCVHAGGGGGWYRNIAFVPAYNDLGRSAAQLSDAPAQEVSPYGVWWADWASTSDEWIKDGSETGGDGAAYDYAVLHVQPDQGSRSLEETVEAALDIDFSAPSAAGAGSVGAWGYPAAPPYNGLRMFKCLDRPGRLSLSPDLPPMYRIGCTMTGGSSGGGWFRMVNGRAVLVSDTSIGPSDHTWLAGPRLGAGAERLYESMSRSYGGR